MFETHLSIDQGSFLVPAMVITVLGLIVGSFLNVVIYRLPKMSASDDATALLCKVRLFRVRKHNASNECTREVYTLPRVRMGECAT